MATTKFTFTWPYEGTNVCLAGSFNHWTPISMIGTVTPKQPIPGPPFQLDMDLLPGSYQYKFVVDQNWYFDIMKQNCDDGAGNRNNVVSISEPQSRASTQHNIKKVHKSVANVIFNNNKEKKILCVQRPPHCPDLPNIWGLPAGNVDGRESFEDAARRTGEQKLGVRLRLVHLVTEVKHDRKDSILHMKIFEAQIIEGEPKVPQSYPGMTQYQNWKWSTSDLLEQAANKGYLCCQVYLDTLKANSEAEPIPRSVQYIKNKLKPKSTHKPIIKITRKEPRPKDSLRKKISSVERSIEVENSSVPAKKSVPIEPVPVRQNPRKLIVLKIFGSVLFQSGKPDIAELRNIASCITKLASSGYHLVVVVGGGIPARHYVEVAQTLSASQGVTDQLSILVSRLNARVLIEAIGDDNIVHADPAESLQAVRTGLNAKPVVVLGGLQPGQGTTAVAVLCAEYCNASKVICFSHTNGIYSPNSQQRLDTVTFTKLRELSKNNPENSVLDEGAITILERSKIQAQILGKQEDLVGAVQGKPLGTLVLVN